MAKLKTKEEVEVETLRSWMEVGRFPARPEEEAWGLLIEVNLIYLPFLYLQQLFGVLPPHFPFYLLFYRDWIYESGPVYCMKRHGIWKGRYNTCRWRYWRSWRQQLLVQRQRVCMGSWGEQYHTPLYPHLHLLPRNLPHPLLYHFPSAPSGTHGTWSLCSYRTGIGIHLLYCPFSRERFLPTCNSFVFSWGTSSMYTNVRLRLQGGPINLPCHHLCTCAKGTPGSGVGVPPLQQVLFQPWHLWAPKKGHLNM